MDNVVDTNLAVLQAFGIDEKNVTKVVVVVEADRFPMVRVTRLLVLRPIKSRPEVPRCPWDWVFNRNLHELRTLYYQIMTPIRDRLFPLNEEQGPPEVKLLTTRYELKPR